MTINRLPHVVAVASKFRPDPSEPMVVMYWSSGHGLGSFFPLPYTPDIVPIRWNLTECVWIVPGTVTE